MNESPARSPKKKSRETLLQNEGSHLTVQVDGWSPEGTPTRKISSHQRPPDIPDWLKGISSLSDSIRPPDSPVVTPPSPHVTPDWLKSSLLKLRESKKTDSLSFKREDFNQSGVTRGDGGVTTGESGGRIESEREEIPFSKLEYKEIPFNPTPEWLKAVIARRPRCPDSSTFSSLPELFVPPPPLLEPGDHAVSNRKKDRHKMLEIVDRSGNKKFVRKRKELTAQQKKIKALNKKLLRAGLSHILMAVRILLSLSVSLSLSFSLFLSLSLSFSLFLSLFLSPSLSLSLSFSLFLSLSLSLSLSLLYSL